MKIFKEFNKFDQTIADVKIFNQPIFVVQPENIDAFNQNIIKVEEVLTGEQ